LTLRPAAQELGCRCVEKLLGGAYHSTSIIRREWRFQLSAEVVG